MLTQIYDALIRYASEGPLTCELHRARLAYVARTGELFESDAAFERRIVAFLEWYTIDRPALGQAPPVVLFEAEHAAGMDAAARDALDAWRTATMSLFALRRLREHEVLLDDLFTGEPRCVQPSAQLLGLGPGDILMARVVAYPPQQRLTDGVCYFPPAARRLLRRFAKVWRQAQPEGRPSVDVLHHLVFLVNRCERYRHVDPKKIFAEGLRAAAPGNRLSAATASAQPAPGPP